MKITEKKLIKIIKESTSKILNEYRSSSRFDNGIGGDKGYDGDRWYVKSKTGEIPDTDTLYINNKVGKRGKTNSKYKDFNGNEQRATVDGANKYTDGKGKLCYDLKDTMDKIFFGNGKIEWTENEKNLIDDIRQKIGELAQLTKTEGNKKRGYGG